MLQKLEKHHFYEEKVNEAIKCALQEEPPDKSIEVIIKKIGQLLQCDRSYIFEKNICGDDDNTYEWVQEGVEAYKDKLQNVDRSVCKSWYEGFKRQEVIVIKDVEEIKYQNSIMYEILSKQDIKSLVVVPLFDGREVFGFFGVDNIPSEIIDYASEFLKTAAYFIVFACRNRNMMRKLERLSLFDQLTGLNNRTSFAIREKECECMKEISCVVFDVNNLKGCNDVYGHQEGDRLLSDAADCIKKAFSPIGDCYRVGGDEFYVLVYSVNTQLLDDAIARLDEYIALRNQDRIMPLAIAWGYEMRENDESIQHMLSRADKKMYQMKNKMKKETKKCCD